MTTWPLRGIWLPLCVPILPSLAFGPVAGAGVNPFVQPRQDGTFHSDERVIVLASGAMVTRGEAAGSDDAALTRLPARSPPQWTAHDVHSLSTKGPEAESAFLCIKKALDQAHGSSGERMVAFLDRSQGDPEILMPLFVVALKRQDWLMRRAVAFAITHHAEHGASAAPILKDLLATEQNPNVRYALAEALGSVDRSEMEFALQVLLELFRSESEEARWAREHAINTLVDFGASAQPALPDLIRFLDENWEAALVEEPRGRTPYPQKLLGGIIQVLGELGPHAREALPRLKRIARDGNPSLAMTAQFACFAIATETREAYFRGLSARLRKESADHARRTVLVLRMLMPDTPAAQTFLMEALDDHRWVIRLQAACALADAGVGGEKIHSILISGMTHHDTPLRMECIRLLEAATRE